MATSHPFVNFAHRYSDPSRSYLSAYVAIARVDTLVEDVKMIRQTIDVDNPNSRTFPWFGAEIMSYYAVGYATCLEWHARSRFVDLITFNPSFIKGEDLKGKISDKLLVQMVSENASVAHLVGASINVTSKDGYISLINRVFQQLGIEINVAEWLSGTAEGSKICWLKPNELGQIDELFRFRHQLVHEIGSHNMGHFNIRDNWSPDDAIFYGRVVASLMCGLEAALTEFAPPNFPNLLDNNGWPVSPLGLLEAEVKRLEEIANHEINKADWDNARTVEFWNAELSSSHIHAHAQREFVDNAAMLHWRYFDARTPLKLAAIKGRISYLTELLGNFTAAHLDDPDGEIPAVLREFPSGKMW